MTLPQQHRHPNLIPSRVQPQAEQSTIDPREQDCQDLLPLHQHRHHLYHHQQNFPVRHFRQQPQQSRLPRHPPFLPHQHRYHTKVYQKLENKHRTQQRRSTALRKAARKPQQTTLSTLFRTSITRPLRRATPTKHSKIIPIPKLHIVRHQHTLCRSRPSIALFHHHSSNPISLLPYQEPHQWQDSTMLRLLVQRSRK